MTDEAAYAWSRAKQVLQSALERPPEDRAGFVTQACGGDSDLQLEVESLLAAHDAAGSFGEYPAIRALRMADAEGLGDPESPGGLLRAGDRLGPYRIDAWIGAGGMGEVYKATDTRLQRFVALKILPHDVRAQPDLAQRLAREARAVAALRHPHICILHDVGQATTDSGQALAYLVMEYLEGESLAARLAQGPLRLDQVFRYGLEIAEALVETHRHGIVHRDLKPGNIMLTSGGAKLLDFGVAKRQAAIAGTGTVAETSDSLTAASSIVGTLHYLTPEQLEGKAVDARTDVFAFGALLYEMVTGTKAFGGESDASVVAAILDREPAPLTQAATIVPRGLEPFIHKCLRKQPSERWQSSGELLDHLRRIASDFAVGRRSPPWSSRRRVRLIWSAAAVVFGASLMWKMGLAAGILIRRDVSAGDVRGNAGNPMPPMLVGSIRQLTPGEELEIDPSISPDGKFVAYSAGNANQMRVFIRATTGGRPIQLTDEPSALEYQPRWSPDGNDIVYVTRRGAFVAPAFGGTSRRLDSAADAAGSYAGEHVDVRVTDASWSPDGQHLAIAHGGVLAIVARDGSERERVLTRMNADLHHCSWSPSGQWIACTAGNWRFAGMAGLLGTIAPSQILIIPSNGGSPIAITDLKASNQSPAWTANSRHLYFVSDRRGGLDVYGVEISGDGHAAHEPLRVTTGLGAYSISFASDGRRLAYTAYASRANVWSLEIPGKGPVNTSAARPLTHGNQITEAMRVSADQKWLFYDATVDGNGDIYRVPTSGGPAERLTTHPAGEFAPELSPDGRLLAYHSWRTQTRDIFVQPLDGGPIEQVTNTPAQECYPMWLPDSRSIVFRDLTARNGINWFSLTRRDGSGRWSAPEHLEFIDGIDGFDLMPDGRTLAYVAGRTVGLLPWTSKSRRDLYTAVPNSPDPIPDSIRGGRTGKVVYVKSHDQNGMTSFWSIPVEGGRPTLLVKFDDPARQSARFDFDVDATHFYFTIEERHSNVWLADVTEQ